MVDVSDDLAAVQVALNEAQESLQGLELAVSLQRQEFFQDASSDSSVGSSAGEDSLEELKLAIEAQVLQLTEQLQQLTDAQLARDLQRQLLTEASQQAQDHRLAACIGDREDEGPSSAAVEALGQSLSAGASEECIKLTLTFEAEMEAGDPGAAGCGAVLTSPAGDVLWKGSGALESASLLRAQLFAATLGLRVAADLGLGGRVLLQCSSASALSKLQEGEGAAHSSSIGPLVEEAQRLLSSFPGWIARRVEPALTAEAAQLARTALWPSPSLSGATAGAGEEKRATISQVKGPADQPLTANDTCGICLQDVPSAQFYVIGTCLHRFCRDCLRRHAQTVIRSRAHPVPCPQVACGAAISSPECELLLAASAVDVAMYKQVEAEASIPDHHRFYCPSPHCSTPLHLESDPAPDSPISCPACSTKTCAWCRTVWHKGFSCQEYRELPCHLRQPEDLALLSVAQRRRWQQCGKCKHMIELGEGCRHITCKCGYEFCYSCGKPWQKVPGERSRQTCRCELFDTTPVRDEAEAEPEPEPAPAPPAPPPDASAVPPWVPHHVRPVYKTKLCMYHPDCHRGDRCWFAHGAGELREPHWLGSTPRTRGAPSDSTDSDSDSDWL